MNAFLLLKIASSFQAAANHSSDLFRPHLLIDLESNSSELYKNAIKIDFRMIRWLTSWLFNFESLNSPSGHFFQISTSPIDSSDEITPKS